MKRIYDNKDLLYLLNANKKGDYLSDEFYNTNARIYNSLIKNYSNLEDFNFNNIETIKELSFDTKEYLKSDINEINLFIKNKFNSILDDIKGMEETLEDFRRFLKKEGFEYFVLQISNWKNYGKKERAEIRLSYEDKEKEFISRMKDLNEFYSESDINIVREMFDMMRCPDEELNLVNKR